MLLRTSRLGAGAQLATWGMDRPLGKVTGVISRVRLDSIRMPSTVPTLPCCQAHNQHAVKCSNLVLGHELELGRILRAIAIGRVALARRQQSSIMSSCIALIGDCALSNYFLPEEGHCRAVVWLIDNHVSGIQVQQCPKPVLGFLEVTAVNYSGPGLNLGRTGHVVGTVWVPMQIDKISRPDDARGIKGGGDDSPELVCKPLD